MNSDKASSTRDVSGEPPQSTNGRTRPLLAALGATTAPPKFGSQSVVTTVVESDCRIEVVDELFPLIVAKLRRRSRRVEPVTVDPLDASALVESILTEFADLCTPPPEIDELRTALDLVVAAKQARGTDVVARIQEALRRIIDPAVQEVRRRIVALADSSPERLGERGQETLELLARVKPAAADASAAIQRATELLVRTAAVAERNGEFAPEDQKPIIGTLTERTRTAVRGAFSALVRELATKYLLAKWPTLTDAADSLVRLEGELTGQLDAMNQACEAWVHAQREIAAEPPCNTTLRLPGTSAEAAIAGVLQRHRLTGRADLVTHALDQGIKRLRETLELRGEQEVAAQPAVRLLTTLPAADGFAVFRDALLEELEPTVQSVYGRLQQFGIRQALLALLKRSRLTCDPGPRGSTQFKLNVYRMVVVSLPKVLKPGDHTLRQAIADVLDAKSVCITEHAASFDEIVVHRIGGGWPWQVLPSNGHFCNQYVASATAGHRPHLVEVLPESPRGGVNPAYSSLPHERPAHGQD